MGIPGLFVYLKSLVIGCCWILDGWNAENCGNSGFLLDGSVFFLLGWDVMWQNYIGSRNSGFLRYGSILFLLDWDEMLHSYTGLDSLCEGFRVLLDWSFSFCWVWMKCCRVKNWDILSKSLVLIANRWNQTIYNASHEACLHCSGKSSSHTNENHWEFDEEASSGFGFLSISWRLCFDQGRPWYVF